MIIKNRLNIYIVQYRMIHIPQPGNIKVLAKSKQEAKEQAFKDLDKSLFPVTKVIQVPRIVVKTMPNGKALVHIIQAYDELDNMYEAMALYSLALLYTNQLTISRILEAIEDRKSKRCRK